MKISEVMTTNVRYVESTSTLMEAAKAMRELDCGFLPISDQEHQKLQGVITDRDIAIRGVAKGMDPASTTVDQIKSQKVLYCFADDELSKAAESMRKQAVYRLVVLNNPEEKKLCGILSLGDIFRVDKEGLASDAAKEILKHVA